MYIRDLYFQDPEIGSLVIFVISVLLCYSCDCDFTAFRNRCIGVVPRTLSDIGCLIVTCEVTGVPSIEWLMNW